MAVWPFLMALSAAVAAASVASRDKGLITTSAAILAAYIIGRVVKSYIPPDLQPLAFAVLWMAVAVIDASQRHIDTKTALIAATALCYLGAKITQAPWVIGSPWFVASDVFAVLAMLWFGWSAHAVYRDDDMGYTGGRGLADFFGRAVPGEEAGR